MTKKATMLFLSLLLSINSQALAYAPEKGHIPISKVALQAFNQCFPKLAFSAEQQTRILQGNAAMDKGTEALNKDITAGIDTSYFSFSKRTFNWHFFPGKEGSGKHNTLTPRLLGMLPLKAIDQSMQRLWTEAEQGFSTSSLLQEKLLYIGALLHLLEDMSVPAHVVPVYHAVAFDDAPASILVWLSNLNEPLQQYSDYIAKDLRGNMLLAGLEQELIVDAIDHIAVDDKALSDYAFNKLTADCQQVVQPLISAPYNLADKLANFTKGQIQHPIDKCAEVTWQRFWDGKLEGAAAAFFSAYNTEAEFPLFGRAGVITDKQGKFACTMQEWDERYFELLTTLHKQALIMDVRLLYWAATKLHGATNTL